MPTSLLAPAAILALWTLIMLIWLGVSRFSAIARSGVDVKNAPPGGRGQDLEAILPPQANWKRHNYSHLLEQPVLFYAVILCLHLSGGTSDLTRYLAWAYVALRIIHSLWQATTNRIPVRLMLFTLSTICLFALTILAVVTTMG
ncbi:MAPEG family protein [Sphingopyxis yananensis]|uniref:MAPEG family protein n=1 Tax=Sphingopyxis yananensis TaxID=2886687 RepID=UPI001D123C08|nr:MAPEG family protein [Sphingopyxis yananensis]MCC2603578.1 MAPEG family protein [Sphingopyxis yananensis]